MKSAGMKTDSEFERPVRLRERLRGETHAAILAAAELVFADEGLDRARMESIAARAGVAVGTLYNHFEDREALLSALVHHQRAALLGRLDAALAAGKGRSFEEELGALLRALVEHWAAHRGLISLLFQSDWPGRTARGRGAILGEIVRRAEAVLCRGRSEGKLRPDAAGLQAAMLVGMARGVLVQDVMRDGGEVPVDRADRVLEVFLRGAGR